MFRKIRLTKLQLFNIYLNFLSNLLFVLHFQVLGDVCGKDLTTKSLLPTVIALSSDNVPNVRFNVAKTLQIIGAHIEKE